MEPVGTPPANCGCNEPTMKAILLIALAAGATVLTTGCETVAVVDSRPAYGSTQVYYSSGRPYYYTGRTRYWGYPAGYSGYRGYRDHDHHHSYSRNVEVERNTYVVNNNRTVYRGSGGNRDARYRSGNVSRTSTVKTKGYYSPGQNQGRGHAKKKKNST